MSEPSDCPRIFIRNLFGRPFIWYAKHFVTSGTEYGTKAKEFVSVDPFPRQEVSWQRDWEIFSVIRGHEHSDSSSWPLNG
jgi:hypothetical protein